MTPALLSRSVALVAAGLLSLGALTAFADDPPAPPQAPTPKEVPPAPAAPVAPAAPTEPVKPETPPEPTKAPDFKLKDVDGKERTLTEFAGKWIVVEWTNYECGYVKKHYAPVPGATEADPVKPGNMPSLQAKYTAKGVVWLSICSSGLKKDGTPKEGYWEPDQWKAGMKERMAVPTALLLDRDGAVGKAYGAQKTPTVYIVDPKGMIVYQGAVDDQPKPKSNPAEAVSYIAEALDAGLAGQPLPRYEVKAYG
jgi:peroxiredoxin